MRVLVVLGLAGVALVVRWLVGEAAAAAAEERLRRGWFR